MIGTFAEYLNGRPFHRLATNDSRVRIDYSQVNPLITNAVECMQYFLKKILVLVFIYSLVPVSLPVEAKSLILAALMLKVNKIIWKLDLRNMTNFIEITCLFETRIFYFYFYFKGVLNLFPVIMIIQSSIGIQFFKFNQNGFDGFDITI